MTPVERLRAAIEKLERLKAESTPSDYDELGFRLNYGGEPEDGDIARFVVMFSTLDSLLALFHYWRDGYGPNNLGRECLALADAIIGGAS